MSSEAAGNWCLIESDPGVFTELIRDYGARGFQVEELWSLDADRFNDLKPIYGLIFLFKLTDMESQPSGEIVKDSRLDQIFFAKQVINNACATQAILSILMNIDEKLLTNYDSPIYLGKMLMDLKEFCSFFDPNLKGLTISNSEQIRTVHNSFASQTLFELDSSKSTKNDDLYHFVSYVPINGRLYELDGLRDGPIDLGAIAPGQDWLDVVRPVIERRINKYSNDIIQFNLLAVIADRRAVYERQLSQIDLEIEAAGLPEEFHLAQKAGLQQLIDEEEEKFRGYKIENIRRKHNYLPFIVELLRLLGKDKKLMPLYEKAKEKALAKKREEEEDN